MAMTDARPAILFLCQTLPYPPDGGAHIRTYNVLRLLSEYYQIDALCFYRKSVAHSVEQSIDGLRPLVRSIEVFPIPQEHSRIRLGRDHLLSILSRSVYTRHTFSEESVRARIRRLIEERKYALVHLDSLDLSTYLPELAPTPVVCVHHNIESKLLRRRAALDGRFLRRAYVHLQGGLMEREEALWAPRVALNVVCSPDDKRDLEDIAPGARVAVVPNGVDVQSFTPAPEPGEGVVFVGGLTWFPNKDALEYFAADLLPRIHALGHTPQVQWVGRASSEAIELYSRYGVKLTGYVEDVRTYVHRARCYVVPLRVGGGTRLKILDAWAMGKAVVSTSIGCEGLEAQDGWNILIRDDPADFAQAVVDVLTDDILTHHLAVNARATAEQIYAWGRIGSAMLAEYRRVEEALSRG